MADSPIHVLRRFLDVARPPLVTDAELLRRYAANRDESAFAELVGRHGPMVLGTAARIVGADPCAEDAFQTAFLALARHARSVRGESIAGWLHRTTVRAAIRLRPKPITDVCVDHVAGPVADPLAEASWREVRQILDREIDALPARLRMPLLLCYLQTLTRDEAADRLGLSLRTLERRLTHGRAILQARLRRRGVGTIGLAAVAAGAWARPVPAALIEIATRSARAAHFIPHLATPFAIAASSLILAVGLTVGLSARPSATAGDPPTKSPPPPPVAKESPATELPDLPLPPGAIRRFGSLAWRHNGGIYQAVLSADGKTLATLSRDSLSVWDTRTGQQKFAFRGLDLGLLFEPGNVAIATDGSWVAHIAATKSVVRIIDIATGKERLTLGPVLPADNNRNALKFRSIWTAPDGNALLFCDNKKLTSFDVKTGKQAATVDLPGRVVAISGDGKKIVAHDQNEPSNAYVCELATGKEIARLDGDFNGPGNGWSIRAVFSSDSKRIATLSTLSSNVRIWDAENGKLTGNHERAKSISPGDDPRLAAVTFDKDGKTLFAAGLSSAGIRRWDLATGKELAPLLGPRNSVSTILIPPAGDLLYVCGDDSLIRRWDLATSKELSASSGYSTMAIATRSPDGRTVVTCDLSSQLRVWDVASGKLTHMIPLSGEYSGMPMSFSPNGKSFACAVSPAGVTVFDTTTWKVIHEWKLPESGPRRFQSLAFLADGSGLLLYGGPDQTFRLDFDAKQPRWTFKEQALAVKVSPDRKHFAISVAKGLSIRSIADGNEVRLVPVEPDPESNVAFPIRTDAMAFSPDGRLLAATRWDTGDVYVWNATTGREVYRLTGHARPQETRIMESAIAFSPDGRWLATGHADRTVRIWEMAIGKEARRIDRNDARVSVAEFGRDGRTLLTVAAVDVLLWDLLSDRAHAGDLGAFWTDLASDDAMKAYRAAGALALRKDEATEFLKGKLVPVPAIDAEKTAKLVADLDSDRFAVREAATKALTNLGGAARAALEKGLANGPSAEGSKRIEELLERLHKPLAGSDAREVRAIQVLQWINSDAARALLKNLAAGADGARLTEEARRTMAVLAE